MSVVDGIYRFVEPTPDERKAMAEHAHRRRVEYRERVQAEAEQDEVIRKAEAAAEALAAERFCAGLDAATLERARRRVLRSLPPLYQSLSVAESRTLRLRVYRLLTKGDAS